MYKFNFFLALFDDSDNDKNYELPIADCSKKSILNYGKSKIKASLLKLTLIILIYVCLDSENDEQNDDTLTAVNSATLNQHGICLGIILYLFKLKYHVNISSYIFFIR